MEDSFTIKHVSKDYIIHDIMVMTALNLRPGKAAKDKARIQVLNSTKQNYEVNKLLQQLDKLSIANTSTLAPTSQPVSQNSTRPACSATILESDDSLYWFPVNNVTMIKIQKVLPFICSPHIVNQYTQDMSLWTGNLVKETSEHKTYDIKNKKTNESGDALGDQYKHRFNNDAFNVNTVNGRKRIKDACIALTRYINDIVKMIDGVKTPYEWIIKIGAMVYSYQPSEERFYNNPLLLVHLIKMMCDGLEYNVPYPELQEAVSQFIGALKDLEVKCYNWTKLNYPSHDS